MKKLINTIIITLMLITIPMSVFSIEIQKPNYLPGPESEFGEGVYDSSKESKNPTILNLLLPNISKNLYKWGIAISLIMFIIGGIKFFMTTGDDTKYQNAQSSLFGAIIGVAIIFFAFTIINILINMQDFYKSDNTADPFTDITITKPEKSE